MKTMAKKIKILFLCTGNSCRSQMAEGWAKTLKGEEIKAFSAGVETHALNPLAVKVMAEAGVDITHQRSKLVDKYKQVAFDAIITLCGHAHENCPYFPGGGKIIHVGFDDPPQMARELAEKGADEKAQLDCYRQAFVETLPESLDL
jgi:arsenate reductase